MNRATEYVNCIKRYGAYAIAAIFLLSPVSCMLIFALIQLIKWLLQTGE